jgi:hypothetical protein
LDHPATELDVDNLGKLLLAIAEIGSQLIVTSVHERGLKGHRHRTKVSRGTRRVRADGMKLLAAPFNPAQLRCHHVLGAIPRTLRLDDPATALDVDNLGKLLFAIAEIVKPADRHLVARVRAEGIEIGRRFHVEQGKFEPMV